MSGLLYGFRQTWQAEKLKIKGSYMVLLALVLGILFPVLFTITHYFESSGNQGNVRDRLPFNFFEENFDFNVEGFGFFFFPLAIILLVARLAGIEHKTDAWKLIETQPVSRLSIWLVKWLMACLFAAFVILAFLIATLIMVAVSLSFQEVHPAANFGIPVKHLLWMGFRLWVAGLGLLTTQLGISIYIRSTVWPIVIGVVALIITNVAGTSNQAVASFWPYAVTGYSARYPGGSEMGAFLLPAEWQGLLWVLLAPLAFCLYNFRGYIRHSFASAKAWGVSFMAIVLLVLGSWWVQSPANLPLLTNRTVIAGYIEADHLPDSVEIFSLPLELKIQTVAVKPDGNFHSELNLLGSLELLGVKAGKNFNTKVYAGKGDSLFLKWRQGNIPGLQQVQVLGTAIATNQYFNKQTPSWSGVWYNLQYPQTLSLPQEFYKGLVKEWQEKVTEVKKFRTVDGFGLSGNMQALKEKLISVEYLQMALFEYPVKKNLELKDTAIQKALPVLGPVLATIEPFDSTLSGWPSYSAFLRKWLVMDLPAELDKDSAYLAILLQRTPDKTRDRLLYDLSLSQLQTSRDSISRARILQHAFNLKDARFLESLQKENDLLNRLRLGQPAPLFTAYTYDNKPVSIDSLRGKYLAIDVWATWCGPCRTQSPIFERIAAKYKNDPIQFLALSVDEDRNAWNRHMVSNSSKILQWHADDIEGFSKMYGLDAIPRFILIDPQGRFINAQLPMPDNPNFELLLRQALGLKGEEG